MTPGHLPISTSLTDVILIRGYTREAGVRGLEREIGAVLRHAAVRIAESPSSTGALHIDAADLERILGPRRFESEVAMRTNLPGVATGLAWTPAGGDILFIEASQAPGKGGLILTGQLGEVMRGSAQAALSQGPVPRSVGRAAAPGTVRSPYPRARQRGAEGRAECRRGHLRRPRLPSSRPAGGERRGDDRGDLAQGLVLPVGGIKEKVLAALAAGIARVLLPARNRNDLDEIPEAPGNDWNSSGSTPWTRPCARRSTLPGKSTTDDHIALPSPSGLTSTTGPEAPRDREGTRSPLR